MTQVRLTTKNCKKKQFKTLKITNPNIASVILNLMSLDTLRNKQTIILHNCEINSEKYDVVITPHKQTIIHLRVKRQTTTRKVLSKQRQITRKRFSKRRNAVSESKTSNLEELYSLKDSVKKVSSL